MYSLITSFASYFVRPITIVNAGHHSWTSAFKYFYTNICILSIRTFYGWWLTVTLNRKFLLNRFNTVIIYNKVSQKKHVIYHIIIDHHCFHQHHHLQLHHHPNIHHLYSPKCYLYHHFHHNLYCYSHHIYKHPYM